MTETDTEGTVPDPFRTGIIASILCDTDSHTISGKVLEGGRVFLTFGGHISLNLDLTHCRTLHAEVARLADEAERHPANRARAEGQRLVELAEQWP